MSKKEAIAKYEAAKAENDSLKAELASKKEREALKAELAKNKALKAERDALKAELAALKRLFSNSKKERFESALSPEQLSLFNKYIKDEIVNEPVGKEITYTRGTTKKAHPGRNPLPENLPTREVIIEPEEDTTDLVKIGEDITETIEYTPASLVKVITRVAKYATKDGTKIITGNLPDRPIQKGIPEASLLAHLFVSKFVDHLPFYRQRKQLKRDYNWELASSTINDWFIACCTLLEPLYNNMLQQLLQSSHLQADESPIKVLDNDKPNATHQGYQWVYRCVQTGVVIFHYRKGRGQHGPKEILKNYSGYLQSDGYVVYDKIAKVYGLRQVGCWAHARRKFFEAKDSDENLAVIALKIFQQIYTHERESKLMDPEHRHSYRKEHLEPLFNNLYNWAIEHQLKVLPKSPIGKAINYLLNQWRKLNAVLEDGALEIDNNLIENKIRPLALGRKNYLFAGSHDAAQRIAMMYSFFATCAAKEVNPYQWLKRTLEEIPGAKMTELDKLLPGYEEKGE